MRRNGSPQPGQVLLVSVVLLAVVLSLSGAFISYLGTVQKSTNIFSARAAARAAAQSGIDKAVWCLNQSSGTNCGGTYGGSFTGETGVSVGGNAFYTSAVATVTGSQKTLTATGYYPTVENPVAKVTLKAEVTVTTTSASFYYGVQTGNGGFELSNNAYVIGNIYANGDVIGSTGAYVDGSVWVAGGTALSPDQDQSTNNEDYTFGQSSPVIDIAQSFRLSADNVVNKISLYLKKSGSPNDVTVNILADDGGVPSDTVIASTTLNASNVTTSFAWVDATFSTPPALTDGTTYWLSVDASSSASKYWIIGSLTNNGYGNGIGMVSDDWDDPSPVWANANRDFAFKVWTGGVNTKIDNLHVYDDAHANTIEDSDIDGNAYYQTLTSTTVDGTSNPGSADPGPQAMPISEGQIDQWKIEAANGGTITGDVSYTDGSPVTLGPKKIVGNLTVDNNTILTVNGTIYVTGDVTFQNNVTIRLDSGYGSGSGMIIADGKILVSNNVSFQGSGQTGSYVLILSTNGSLDSSSPAIDLNNNSTNSIFYASNGVIRLQNNATLKEITAFKIFLSNNATVTYESGLANVNFSSGPGGSWTLQQGSTREIRQ
jgi:hypothetical protein